VRTVETAADLKALPRQLLASARLVAFCTDTLVPAAMLDRLRFGAYNFHSGSPHFPGWGAVHFAIHKGATEFGATAHLMTRKVDAGPIVGIERFWIAPGTTVAQLEELTYASTARLFWRLARPLAIELEPLPTLPIEWKGRKGTRRRTAKMCGAAPVSPNADSPNSRSTGCVSTRRC
jgi:methionyl-tRNA formyltransferase